MLLQKKSLKQAVNIFYSNWPKTCFAFIFGSVSEKKFSFSTTFCLTVKMCLKIYLHKNSWKSNFLAMKLYEIKKKKSLWDFLKGLCRVLVNHRGQSLPYEVSNIRSLNLYLETKLFGLIFNKMSISCLTAETEVQTICLLSQCHGNEK